MESKVVEILDLTPGMILEEEIRSSSGLLLAGKGQEVTYPLMVRLKNHRRLMVQEKVGVLLSENSRADNRMHATGD